MMGVEVVLIGHSIAVEAEQIVFGCANLDQLRHVPSLSRVSISRSTAFGGQWLLQR
jgi:hypothetical protein